MNEIHCYHKILISLSCNDSYQNLIIVNRDVHKQIHAIVQDAILRYLYNFDLTVKMIINVNKFLKLANLKENLNLIKTSKRLNLHT